MTDRTAVETVNGVDPVATDTTGTAADTTSDTTSGTTPDNDAQAPDVTGEAATESAAAATEEASGESADLAETAGTPIEGVEVAEQAPEKASAKTPAKTSDKAADEPGGDSATAVLTPASDAKAEPTRTVADAARGTRFAGRYRLEDKLSSNGKSATWRAVDEKLRRAVGIHLVAAGSEHARSVMAAARAAALVGDPRFVQVLDAAEEDGLVYVVKEWLPDADNLASLLAVNPLPPHEAYEMVRSVADAMAVAHRAGLSHLRLDPDNILRMHTGQYKIVGLSVEAALYGHDTTDAARDDTRSIGSLLYACLARRWPEAAAYGLPEAPRTGGRLCTPGQVKAHVHGPLEAVAMRALGHEYKHQPPFETPEDVVTALAAIPPVLPPEPAPPVSAAGADFDDEYTPTALLTRGNGGPPPATRPPTATAPPPALGGGFGQAVKVVVAVIVLIAVILTTWQIAAHVNKGHDEGKPSPTPSPNTSNTQPAPGPAAPPPPPQIVTAYEFDPYGGGQDRDGVAKTYDNNPSTDWHTLSYKDDRLQKLKPGLGIVYDFGKPVDLASVVVDLKYAGPGTRFEVRATPEGVSSTPSAAQGVEKTSFTVPFGTGVSGADHSVPVTAGNPIKSRFVLIWFTDLPSQGQDQFSGSGLKNGITEIHFNP
ncbi:MAG: serine/threonine protein kinase [Streptomycetaceae bacterium]|nr:serine/threonine protein kinase [Streptomycetaceae bacterium]